MQQAYEAVYSLNSAQIIVPAGVTNAVLVEHEATQNSISFKYGSGGSLLIIGVTTGQTMAPADFASLLAGTGVYLAGTSEAFSFNGPTRFYLAGTNATVVVYALRGKNQ